MSQDTNFFKLKNCIESKLWFTSYAIVKIKGKDNFSDDGDAVNLCRLLDCCECPNGAPWLVYKLLCLLSNDEQQYKINERQLNAVQLRNALHFIDKNVSGTIEQDLLRLHDAITVTELSSQELMFQIDPLSLEFLKVHFWDKPSLVQWAIDQMLCIWCTSFIETDSALQDLYANIIDEILTSAYYSSSNNDIQSLYYPKNVNLINQQHLETLLCILSKFNITECRERELDDWICSKLFKVCRFEDVELAFYSRKDQKYFKMWHNFLDEINGRRENVDSLDNASKISSAIFETCQNSHTRLNTNELFIRILKRKTHWILDIIDVAFTLTMNNQLNDVGELLSNPIFNNLWLPLLLKTINHCPNLQITNSDESWEKFSLISKSLRFLIENCRFNDWPDPAMSQVKHTVDNHLNTLDWIMKSRTLPNENEKVGAINHQNCSIQQVFRHLQLSSVLSVVKMFVPDVHNKPFEEINALLTDRNASKTVYQAYCAMLCALKAVLMCDSYNSDFLTIADYYDEMEKYLNDLHPLNLRLEVIENIFTMIFLRHEDFMVTNNNSDCEDDNAGNERSTSPPPQKQCSQYQTGFICNKYAIREILHYLGRCVFVASDKLSELRMDANSTESVKNLEQRISALQNYLTEASWRLKLLTNSNFFENQGLPDLSVDQSAATNPIVTPSINHQCKSNFYKINESSSDEMDLRSDVDISSESGSVNNGIQQNTKRRKRIRKNNSNSESVEKKELKQSREFTLNYMLASKESLIMRCLWKGEYTEAQRIIEMFNMENSHLAGEVVFSRAMRNFRDEIFKRLTSAAEKYPDTYKSKLDSKHSTLDFIRKAARDGIQASRVTSQVETFLASQESNIVLCSDSNNAEEIMTLMTMDLALTLGHDTQISENLTEVAMKHLRACKKLENTAYHDFFEMIYHLYYEKKGMPISTIISDAKIPLSLKEQREYNDFWFDLSRKLKSFEMKTTIIDTINEQPDLEHVKHGMQKIMLACGNGQPYLHRLNAHIDLLRSIAPKSEEVMDICMKSSLLENPIDFYIGYQIFDLNVDLDVLETIANQLQINLVYGILTNCCPKLSSGDCIDENVDDYKFVANQWGTIVLNKYGKDNEEFIDVNTLDPNQCVAEILEELLQIMRDSKATAPIIWERERTKNFYEEEGMKKILRKTQCLMNLDLSHLSFGNHTLAFFLNVWNLMMLHATILIWSRNPPLNDLQHAISLTTLGYEIGDLGLVTLFTLRKKLLGQSLCKIEIFDFEHLEDLNEPAWQDLELQQDSRVIFAMINEYQASPIIKTFHPEALNDELYVAANDYIDYFINLQDQTVMILPQLVKKYDEFYGHLEEKQTVLKKVKHDDTSINYQPFQYQYDITLNYANKSTIASDCILQNTKSSNNAEIWMNRKIKPNLLHYLESHCWLLSYLVKRIHEPNSTLLNSVCESTNRTAVLENLLHSKWAQNLESLFNDNPAVAGLWECVSTSKLWHQFDILLKEGQFEKCFTIIDALPDAFMIANVEIQSLRDRILVHLINNQSNLSEDKILQYLYQIKDVQMLAQIVLANVKEWPVGICEDALRHVLNHVNKHNLPAHCRAHMNEILCRVMVFDKILPYCNIDDSSDGMNWYNIVFRTEKTDPHCIVKSLIDANQHELCLKWLEYQTVSSEIQSLVSQDLFIGLLENGTENFQHARKLLQALPVSLSIKLCKGVMERLESIGALRFIVKYLIENCPTEHGKYQRCSIGVEILDQLHPQDRGLYINLINNPLLMLEQLLMNGKFDSLQRIMKNHSENSRFADFPTEDFDRLVRFYAKKSLDSRVAIQRDMIDGNRSRDASFDGSGEFIMPVTTPTRAEWIPNDKTRECSCCKIVIFSMFNRRHHCRRCGRVVCATCSSQRMRVIGYADSVLVRVCNDCKRQTTLQAQGATSTVSSESSDVWRLSHDETHNRTLREEFCFEYAPNISLCLAILDLHSDSKAYANFLLDRCDEMKKLLCPDESGQINREIDHSIILNMIRSLLVAAKVKCAKLGLNTGLADCDRFLSQVDLIATLVQSDCHALIPRDDLNDHTLRRLRDLLTEKEQWILALGLSTKSGLDTQGVWAAWGKACLRVGYYEGAREKFTHCMEKVHQEDFDDWVVLSHPGDVNSPTDTQRDMEKKESKTTETSKNRPNKDPPLLMEILQILEVSNATDEHSQQLTRTNVTAQEISSTLNNLKAISHGQYTYSKLNCNTRSFRYQESFYYLMMYGSFNSILEFLVRYDELEKCLCYILENDIEPELYFNIVFLGCLKNGTMENLCNAMKSKDPSLLMWKKYLICTCHNLERKQLLHTLYQLQLFMRDYIRAAMTCIRFYVTDASNYIEICSRNHFLIDAQKHLETELQIESFGNRRKKSTSSIMSSGHSSFTMEMEPTEIDRHINTISRQMEIAKFLGVCEKEGRSVNEFLSKLSFMDSEGLQPRRVPTLFGNQQERTHLSVLAILCGRDVEEGFGIAFRVMQDYNLRPQKVYFLVGHILALDKRISSIEQLIKCCRSSGAPNSNIISDRVLAHCVKFLLDRSRNDANPGPRDQIDSLIRIITDVELKIGSYIESKQLKAAYLLAVKHSRAQDIRKILKEADRLGQPAIKSICTKWLQQIHKN